MRAWPLSDRRPVAFIGRSGLGEGDLAGAVGVLTCLAGAVEGAARFKKAPLRRHDVPPSCDRRAWAGCPRAASTPQNAPAGGRKGQGEAYMACSLLALAVCG